MKPFLHVIHAMKEAGFRMAISPALVGALFCAHAAQAQQAPATPAVLETLGAVVVTASRGDTRLEDMPLYTTVITQKEIQNSPAQSLDQLLRNVPGLGVQGTQSAITDPTGHNIKFRGMDKKVLVLLDGMPIHDPFYTTIQWFKIPLSSIERVEVVRGGGSSLWGNLAVGGVINIISKRPRGSDGEASASIGSRTTLNGAISKNFVISDALSISLAADSFNTDGYNTIVPAYNAQYWPGRGASTAYNENMRLTAFFKPSTDLNGFVRMGYHKQNEDIGGYLYGSNVQRSPDLAGSVTKYFDDKSNVQANYWSQWLTFDKYNGAGCYTSTVFACGAPISSTGATAAQQGAATKQYATSYDLNTYREKGGSVMYSRAFRGLLTGMQLGADLRKISGEDDQQSYATPTAALPAAMRLQRKNYGGGAQTFTGVFGQFKLSPLDALELSISTRWDSYASTKGIAQQTNFNTAGTAISSSSGGAVDDVSKRAFNPAFSARYELNDKFSLRGSTYRAFRAPGLNNLYRSFGNATISIANPLLGPETLRGAEVGADWRGGNYSLGATLFAAKVQDVVTTYTVSAGKVAAVGAIPQAVLNICGAGYTGVANTACPGSVAHYTNGQDQRSNGLELEGKWQASRAISLNTYFTRTLTYYQSVTTTDPTGVQLPLVPKNVLGASLVWTPDEQWANSFDIRASDKQTLNLTDAVTDPVQQGGHTLLSASSTYRVNKSLDVFASVVNLTDKEYSDSSASSIQQTVRAMPRTITTGLRTRF